MRADWPDNRNNRNASGRDWGPLLPSREMALWRIGVGESEWAGFQSEKGEWGEFEGEVVACGMDGGERLEEVVAVGQGDVEGEVGGPVGGEVESEGLGAGGVVVYK